jgi:stage II sporulation protein D
MRGQPVAWVWRYVALAGGLAVIAGCAAPRTPAPPPLALPDHVSVRLGNRVVAVPLEEYVLGSALAEVSPVGEPPATVERIFELQAVLARTYAAAHLGRHRADGFDLCDSTHCQLYDPARIKTSRFAQAAREAVARTAGLVITYGQRPAEALFHSDCGGYTAGADTVWGGPALPYLRPAPDVVPPDPHHKWRTSVPIDRLRAALNADAASAVGRRLDALQVTARDVGGRVTGLEVTGEHSHTLRGEQLRAILNATLGERGIQSTRLTVTRAGSTYVFDGTGFGHGVGLCQVGAAARAKSGEPLDAILAHYFPGAHLATGR